MLAYDPGCRGGERLLSHNGISAAAVVNRQGWMIVDLPSGFCGCGLAIPANGEDNRENQGLSRENPQ